MNSHCSICDIEKQCGYEYKPCDCCNYRKFKPKEAEPTDAELAKNHMQFGADMVTKYSRVCKSLNEEARDADELLRMLRLDPSIYRTDGGHINMPKVRAALANPGDYPVMDEAADALEAQAKEIEALKSDLETERIRLAACGVVALSDTPESAASARQMKDEYRSASGDDVARRVDECMRLRAEIEALRADAERYRWLREFRVIINKASVALYGEDLDSAIDAARRK